MLLKYKKIKNSAAGAAEICMFSVEGDVLTFCLECDCSKEYTLKLSECREIEVKEDDKEIYEY